MDVLDYMEKEVGAHYALVLADYGAIYDRAYKVVTLLVGGGATVGVYALGKWVELAGKQPLMWAPAGALALWWFAISAVLLLCCMRSVLLSTGASADTLAKIYMGNKGVFGEFDLPSNQTALTGLRMSELSSKDAAMVEYRKVINRRQRVLKVGYLAIACTPLAAGAGLLLARWLG